MIYFYPIDEKKAEENTRRIKERKSKSSSNLKTIYNSATGNKKRESMYELPNGSSSYVSKNESDATLLDRHGKSNDEEESEKVNESSDSASNLSATSF